MQHLRTPKFTRALKKLPQSVRGAFEKQLAFLLRDLRHPSLHAKKYDETGDVWQARVTDNVRCYFMIEDDLYVLLDIEKHRE